MHNTLAGKTCVMALDAGTTGTTALIFDTNGSLLARGYREFRQIYPRPGWVEHDPEEIWESLLIAVRQALEAVPGVNIAALGITNQRETTVIWERKTGKPVHNAIVWQCRRTAQICRRISSSPDGQAVQEKTGLPVDAYFSATKISWLLDSLELQAEAKSGKLAFGTINTWVLWKLTGGRQHATDVSNAARTLLLNIETGDWDEDLLDIFGVPGALLPEVRSCCENYGSTDPEAFLGLKVPIAGMAGDQQAAAFGQICFEPGIIKHTYGTGGFMIVPTGDTPIRSESGLLTTIAWKLGDGPLHYALEGSNYVCGAAVQWLRDEMRFFDQAADSEALAAQVDDTGGVYLVPAFVGLGAPYWDMSARGAIVGLTRGSGRAHLTRAALESMAYQMRDLFEAVAQDMGRKPRSVRVDGGASSNNLMLQFQSDLLGVPVFRPQVIETTGLGAAYLAGLGTGVWSSLDEVASTWKLDRVFRPNRPQEEMDRLYQGWLKAVERARRWDEE